MANEQHRRYVARWIGGFLVGQLLFVAYLIALWGAPVEIMLVDVGATVPLVMSAASAGQAQRLEKRYFALAVFTTAAGSVLVALATPDRAIQVASVLFFALSAGFVLFFDWFSKPLPTGSLAADGKGGGAANPSDDPSPVPGVSGG